MVAGAGWGREGGRDPALDGPESQVLRMKKLGGSDDGRTAL